MSEEYEGELFNNTDSIEDCNQIKKLKRDN